MTSPSSDVLEKRRYRRHKTQSRRKDKQRQCSKNTYIKNNVPPKITQKRLTKKNGFYFNGAVLTSPHSRGSKGHNAQKPQKRSNDFDLHCLLKAAKYGDTLHHQQCTSGSIPSKESDDFCNDFEPQLKNDKMTVRSMERVNQCLPESVNSQSSSENNSTLFDKSQIHVENISSLSRPTNQSKNSNDSTSLKDHCVNLNVSSETGILQLNLKRYSLTTYGKFAVGIVEALCSEKKKQFPSSNLLEDITGDLNKIYNQSHGKVSLEEQQTSLMISALSGEDNNRRCESQKLELKCQTIPGENSQCLPEDEHIEREQEEKLFKEKSVEAWVNAIPEKTISENKQAHKTKKIILKLKSSQLETEREFLRNIKRSSVSTEMRANPFNNVSNSLPWMLQAASALKHSPNMPSQLPAPVNAVLWGQDLYRRESHHSPFPCSDDQPLTVIQKKDGKAHPRKIWDSSSPFSQLQRPQHSWVSWFKDNKQNFLSGDVSLSHSISPQDHKSESPNLSPFDPPPPKPSAYGTYKHKGSTQRQLNNFDEKQSVWAHFPKLFNKDINENHLYRLDPKRDAKSNYNKDKQSPNNIRFSPRKMF